MRPPTSVGRSAAGLAGGCVPAETAPQLLAAGAAVLVAGAAPFRGGPAAYAENIRRLRAPDPTPIRGTGSGG